MDLQKQNNHVYLISLLFCNSQGTGINLTVNIQAERTLKGQGILPDCLMSDAFLTSPRPQLQAAGKLMEQECNPLQILHTRKGEES